MRGLICSLFFGAMLGCATMSGGGGENAQALHLFGMPATVNLDGKAGPDGFGVRIYANRPGDAKGAAIKRGAVEVLMFDGVVTAEEIAAKEPLQTWKFTPRQLEDLSEKSALGEGYRLTLRWTQAPQRGHITVIARYLPTKGEAIYSSPSTIVSASK
jgi:hypothetical protein